MNNLIVIKRKNGEGAGWSARNLKEAEDMIKFIAKCEHASINDYVIE